MADPETLALQERVRELEVALQERTRERNEARTEMRRLQAAHERDLIAFALWCAPQFDPREALAEYRAHIQANAKPLVPSQLLLEAKP